MTLNLTTRADVTVGRYEALPTAMSDHDVPAPRRFSRRSALIALAATAGAIAVGDAFGIGAAGAASGGLDDPGSALATARRMRFDPTTTIPTTPGGYGAPIPPAAGKLMFPLGIPTAKSNIYVLDNFGDCRGSRGHAGVDILATGGGNPIFAVADGELTQWYTNTGEAGLGMDALRLRRRTRRTSTSTCRTTSTGGTTGSRVKVGDVLGFVGSSGTDSDTNFHLHLEVRPNNVPTNPLPLIDIPPGVAVSPSPLHACIGLPML